MIGYGTVWSHSFTVQSAEHDTKTRGWNGFHLALTFGGQKMNSFVFSF